MKDLSSQSTETNRSIQERATEADRHSLPKRLYDSRAARALAGLAVGATAWLTLADRAPAEPEGGTVAAEIGSSLSLEDIDLPAIGRTTVDTMKGTAPYVLGAAALYVGGLAVSRSDLNRRKLSLANRGYQARGGNRLRQACAGTLIPAIGAVALTTSFSIEEEIRIGPNRMVESLLGDLPPGSEEAQQFVLLEEGSNHFMNNSRIEASRRQIAELQAAAEARGIALSPFHLELTDIELPHKRQTSLVIAAPDASPNQPSSLYPEVRAGADCEIVGNTCALQTGELIVDPNQGLAVGDELLIRGEEFRVAALAEEPQSLLNRLVLVGNEQSMAQLRQDNGNSTPYYGLASAAPSREELAVLLEELNLQEQIDILDKNQLIDQNTNFWEGNGTALMMLLILNISAFGGISMYERQRAEQEQSREQISTLRSMGLNLRDIGDIEISRAAITTAKATLPVYPIALAVSKVANSGITGFNSKVDAAMVAGAAGTILAAKAFGAALLIKKQAKISPAEGNST